MGEAAPKRTDNLDFLALGCMIAASRFMTGGEKAGRLNRWTALNLKDPVVNPRDPGSEVISYADLHLLMANALGSARILDLALVKQFGGDQDWWHDVDRGEMIPAMRFARNVVEHEGAQLVDLAGHGVSGVKRHDVWNVVWAGYRPFASGRFGEEAYHEHFTGESITITLTGLNPPLFSGMLLANEKAAGRSGSSD